ncbi:MAG: hypothetical protein AABZ65_01780 [Candidatus Omnitrophota bacterium]
MNKLIISIIVVTIIVSGINSFAILYKFAFAQSQRNKDEFIKDLDKNQDGMVSREEFPGPDDIFGRLDRDRFISFEEASKEGKPHHLESMEEGSHNQSKPAFAQLETGKCGDGICQDIERERGVCADCLNASKSSVTSSGSYGDNSVDADGFLWGTETYPNVIDQTKGVINETLKINYVKMRLQLPMVTREGETFTAKICMPSQSVCVKQYDLDAAVKLFKENNWSMVPMLSHDNEDKTIDSSDIDNFVDFADWFVSRYKNDARIKYIELVNSPAFWWNGSEKQLLDLSNKTYDRIKNKYPDIMVGTPGFEYWNDASGENSTGGGKAVRQIEYFLDKNNGAKFDFWAFHGYPTVIMDTPTVYPPNKKAKYNKYAGIYGLLVIREKLNDNGWEDRLIIDMEHTGIFPGKPFFTVEEDKLESAYMVQELLLKKTLRSNNKSVLAGIFPLKIASRGNKGEFLWASLNADGSITHTVKAVSILLDKLNQYNWVSRVSGEFDDENQAWIEKFHLGDNKELYIFFKPFEYKTGQTIAFDNKIIRHGLPLSKKPAKVTLTDIYGNISSVIVNTSIILESENAPKFLEVEY